MARPDQRPMRALPTLEERRGDLERCVFCPKLCRTACPVSDADPRETVTPWGKMSMAHFAAHGDVELSREFAAPVWACTACDGCKPLCDHRNDVAGSLLDARHALREAGVAPAAAVSVLERFDEHDAETGRAVRDLASSPSVDASSRVALLLGCGYAKHARDEARDAVRVAATLVGGPVALVEACCGSPLAHAADKDRFAARGRDLGATVGRHDRLLVVDAGCAVTMRRHAEANGWRVRVETLIELAAREVGRLRTLGDGGECVRYHDPCQLARGLGIVEEPRAVLGRILGRAPDEFVERRDRTRCSGAGGLLPVTAPETAAQMARDRTNAHDAAGGGRVITACASSLRSLRKTGAQVDDIVTWIARALGPESEGG